MICNTVKKINDSKNKQSFFRKFKNDEWTGFTRLYDRIFSPNQKKRLSFKADIPEDFKKNAKFIEKSKWLKYIIINFYEKI